MYKFLYLKKFFLYILNDEAHLLKALLKHSVIFNLKLILLKWPAKKRKKY